MTDELKNLKSIEMTGVAWIATRAFVTPLSRVFEAVPGSRLVQRDPCVMQAWL